MTGLLADSDNSFLTVLAGIGALTLLYFWAKFWKAFGDAGVARREQRRRQQQAKRETDSIPASAFSEDERLLMQFGHFVMAGNPAIDAQVADASGLPQRKLAIRIAIVNTLRRATTAEAGFACISLLFTLAHFQEDARITPENRYLDMRIVKMLLSIRKGDYSAIVEARELLNERSGAEWRDKADPFHIRIISEHLDVIALLGTLGLSSAGAVPTPATA